MFLLVLAHPGCSGQNPESRKRLCRVSTTPGNILEFKNPPGNPGNLLEFSGPPGNFYVR